MPSVETSVAMRPSLTPDSVVRFAELVNNRTGTSAALSTKKRKRRAKKKLAQVYREHRRFAKANNLRAVALTLTYRDSADFSQKNVSKFLEKIRRQLRKRGHSLPYTWVLESEGRLHYHFTLWLPRDFILDKAKLAKLWNWGSSWVQSCHSVKSWTRYMSKFDSAEKIPRNAKLFGYGGLDGNGKAAVTRANLPLWLQKKLSSNHVARRIPGGWWANTATGEVFRSPYVWTPAGIILRSAAPPVH